MSSPTSALVLGARGQLGRALLPRLIDAGWQVHAVSRAAQPADPALHWHCIDLFAGADAAPATDIVFSLGPLDGAAFWFARSTHAPRALVAFGSTSAHAKYDSPDPAERALAQRLRDAEQKLAQTCEERGTRLTLLRPTLIYGAGLDRNLTRIAALARRLGFFVLPRGAGGRRQPVHVDDLADAAWRCATSTAALATAYDLPGGETLAYREMVARVLACLDPPVNLYELPTSPLRAALWCAHRVGLFGEAGAGVWARLTTDLVFDAQPARRDFGYAPREFVARAAMFESPRGMVQRTM